MKRGHLSLATWLHGYQTAQVKRSRKTLAVWDFGIFNAQMQALRSWTPAKIKAEWDILDSDPAAFVDNDGPEPHCRRLRIPGRLTGKDEDHMDLEESEYKKVETTSKATKLSVEQIQQVTRGIVQLFRATFVRGSPRGMWRPL